jgi:hypothetical protein
MPPSGWQCDKSVQLCATPLKQVEPYRNSGNDLPESLFVGRVRNLKKVLKKAKTRLLQPRLRRWLFRRRDRHSAGRRNY